MAKDGSGLPPYFNIDPDAALAELEAPATTEGFAAHRRGLCSRPRRSGQPRAGRRGAQTAAAVFHLGNHPLPDPGGPGPFPPRAASANPDLPQGRSETEGGAKWFTLDEVLRLRAHFGAEGSKAKEYRPYRPEGLPAKMVAVANFKGGVGKTSTAAHLAMSAALDGYRVLVIDLDSQGSMTSIFGGRVEDEWQTVFPLLARHYGEHLRAENQRRLDRGEAPQPLDDTLGEAMEMTAADVIQTTHWPNIDLIGAQLNLYWAEFQIPVWRMAARGWKLWDALTDRLAGRRGAGAL